MANTVQIILEIDDQGTVKLRQFQKQAEEATDTVGESSKKMGEAGRLGFFALGNAVEDSARSMGVAGQASRQLGNSVERLAASTLPGFGTAIGVGVLALTSIIQVVREYNSGASKMRDEILKNADSALQLAEKYNAVTHASRQMMSASRLMAEAERKIKILELNAGIKEQSIALKELHKKYQDLSMIPGLLPNLAKQIEERAKIKADIEMAVAKLGYMKTAADFLQRPVPADYLLSERLSAQVEYAEAMKDLWVAQGMDLETQMDMELAIFKTGTAAKTQALIEAGATNQQLRDFQATRTVQGAAMVAQSEIQIHRQKLQTEQQLRQYQIGALSSGLDIIAAITRGKYKAIFIAQQAMHAAQAISSGWAAAAAALAPPPLGLGPVEGAPLALWAKAQGYLAAAAIMAQAFMTPSTGGGGGGGGGAGVPTYPVNPVTGYPTAPAQPAAPNITIIINGREVGINELTTGIVQEISRNNNSIGGFTISMERSA